ncbi:hypothetical protein ACFL6G_04350 [candidate division KSB1 bacterium]
MKSFTFKIDNLIDLREVKRDKIEIPCRDLDIDCLPDEGGGVPFGNYKKCYMYDPDQGICPLVPMNDPVFDNKEMN